MSEIHSLGERHCQIKKQIERLQDEKVQVEALIWEQTNGQNFVDDKVKVTITKSEDRKWDQDQLKEIQKEFPGYVKIEYSCDMRVIKGSPIYDLAMKACTTKERKPTFKVEFL